MDTQNINIKNQNIQKKKIVIFSGGTGSQNLQRSIKNICGDNVDVDIIISAYDNGKSTGEVRKAYGHSILGPSDLRKNQMLQFELYAEQNDFNKAVLDFMNYRFDAENAADAIDKCMNAVYNLENKITDIDTDNNLILWLIACIQNFFYRNYSDNHNNKLLNICEDIKHIDFHDFSISNIIYADIAFRNYCRLSEAGREISEKLGIPNRVHVISDENLYLNAITESGTVITDEGEIVDWNNPYDKIQKVVLVDRSGQICIPSVDDGITDGNCTRIIKEADIIIFSPGTQWSSEIPTYIHMGLNDLIKESKAAKYLIMNNTEDKDMKGVNSAELIKTVSRYLDLHDTTIVYNQYAQFSMRDQHDPKVDSLVKRSICGKLSNSADDKKHNLDIFKFILQDYYRDYLNSDLFVFDFDDTLYSRSNNSEIVKVSVENLQLLNQCRKKSFILSGNSITRFKDISKRMDENINKNIFSMLAVNGGNSIYQYQKEFGLIQKDSLFKYDEIYKNYFDIVRDVISIIPGKIFSSMFENRGNTMISIKPIENNRESVISEINRYLNYNYNGKLVASASGKTTVDIMPSDYSKFKCFEEILKKYYNNIRYSDITYIGDELDKGNDASIKKAEGVKCLFVKNVYDTNIFLRVLNS